MLQSTEHVYFSNYTYSQLHSLVLLIIECCDQPHKHHASIFDKYGDKRFKRASHFVQSELDRGFRVLDVAANHPTSFSNFYDEKQQQYYEY